MKLAFILPLCCLILGATAQYGSGSGSGSGAELREFLDFLHYVFEHETSGSGYDSGSGDFYLWLEDLFSRNETGSGDVFNILSSLVDGSGSASGSGYPDWFWDMIASGSGSGSGEDLSWLRYYFGFGSGSGSGSGSGNYYWLWHYMHYGSGSGSGWDWDLESGSGYWMWMHHFFGSGSGSGSGWESGSGWNDILFWLYQQEMNSGSGGSGYDWLWDVLAEEASGSGSGEIPDWLLHYLFTELGSGSGSGSGHIPYWFWEEFYGSGSGSGWGSAWGWGSGWESGSGGYYWRPGLYPNGTIDFWTLTPEVALDLLDEDPEIFNGTHDDLCVSMFEYCADEYFFHEAQWYGINCHNQSNWNETRSLLTWYWLPCSWIPGWVRHNVRELCNTSLGSDHDDFVECLGQYITADDIDVSSLTDDERGDILMDIDGDDERDARETLFDIQGDDVSAWDETRVEQMLDADLALVLPPADRRAIDEAQNLTIEQRQSLWADDDDVLREIAFEEVENLGNLTEVTCDDVSAILPDILIRPHLLEEIPSSEIYDCFTDDPDAFEGACNVLTPFMDILRDAGVTSDELNDCAACRLCMTRAEATEVIEAASTAEILAMAAEDPTTRVHADNRLIASEVIDSQDASTMTASDIEDIAGVIAYVPQDAIANFSASAVRDALDTIADNLAGNRAQSQAIRDQLSSEDPSLFVANCVIEGLNPRELLSSTASDMGVDGTSQFNCNLPRALARVILDRYRDEQGVDNPSDDSNGNVFGDLAITNLGCMFAQAADSDLLDDFEDEDIILLASVVEGTTCTLDETQTQAMLDRVADIDGEISESDAESMGSFMAGRGLDEIEDCSASQAIVESIGERDVSESAYADGEAEFQSIVQNMCVDYAFVDLRDEDPITEAHVENLGSMLCFISESMIAVADADALREIAEQMSENCMFLVPSAVRTAVIDRADEVIPSMTANDAARFAGFMDDTSRLSDEILDESSTEILGALGTITEQTDARNEIGMPAETNDNIGTIAQEAIASLTTSARRKRTSSISCSDVSTAGSASVYFTASQLSTISDFADCADTLGEIEGWSSTQLDELVTLAKAEWGSDVSTWSSTEIMEAGTIIAGLSVSEIETSLVLDSNDIMVVIGEYDIYSDSQLAAGFDNYLTRVYSDSEDGSSLTSTDIVSLGEFACGASSSVIGNMDNTEYESAMSSVGELLSCDDDTMEAYADKAMDVIGQVEDWTAVDVATVGNMIGGITSSDVRGLTETQIDAISAIAISLVPANTLSGLSTSQIGYFSTVQAEAVTVDQQEEFSNSQLDALEAAGGTIEVDYVDDDSGAAHPAVGLLSMALGLVLCLLAH